MLILEVLPWLSISVWQEYPIPRLIVSVQRVIWLIWHVIKTHVFLCNMKIFDHNFGSLEGRQESFRTSQQIPRNLLGIHCNHQLLSRSPFRKHSGTTMASPLTRWTPTRHPLNANGSQMTAYVLPPMLPTLLPSWTILDSILFASVVRFCIIVKSMIKLCRFFNDCRSYWLRRKAGVVYSGSCPYRRGSTPHLVGGLGGKYQRSILSPTIWSSSFENSSHRILFFANNS